jgi:GNAT superfamily N-acetyltransferase
MPERLELVAAVGPAIDSETLESAMVALSKCAWYNCTEDTQLTDSARVQYFQGEPTASTVVIVGTFDDQVVSASWNHLDTWRYRGSSGEYVGYIGRRILDMVLFGVREPYRGLGFGTQTLAATAHVGHMLGCNLLVMNWADFQWDWFKTKGGFEGEEGYLAESIRALPATYAGFSPDQLSFADLSKAE